tara:strand:+ start:265 stop:408 length:144 start_codon:yes stop_codon:yes gene_type:complete
VQLLNASVPIDFTDFGIVYSVRAEQAEKVELPIDAISEAGPRVTLFN